MIICCIDGIDIMVVWHVQFTTVPFLELDNIVPLAIIHMMYLLVLDHLVQYCDDEVASP